MRAPSIDPVDRGKLSKARALDSRDLLALWFVSIVWTPVMGSVWHPLFQARPTTESVLSPSLFAGLIGLGAATCFLLPGWLYRAVCDWRYGGTRRLRSLGLHLVDAHGVRPRLSVVLLLNLPRALRPFESLLARLWRVDLATPLFYRACAPLRFGFPGPLALLLVTPLMWHIWPVLLFAPFVLIWGIGYG